jgi:hypothetical protein
MLAIGTGPLRSMHRVDGGAPIIVRNEDVIQFADVDEAAFKAICDSELALRRSLAGPIPWRNFRYLRAFKKLCQALKSIADAPRKPASKRMRAATSGNDKGC